MRDVADASQIDRFLEMMAAQAGASTNTLIAYRGDLHTASGLLNGKLIEVLHLSE